MLNAYLIAQIGKPGSAQWFVESSSWRALDSAGLAGFDENEGEGFEVVLTVGMPTLPDFPTCEAEKTMERKLEDAGHRIRVLEAELAVNVELASAWRAAFRIATTKII